MLRNIDSDNYVARIKSKSIKFFDLQTHKTILYNHPLNNRAIFELCDQYAYMSGSLALPPYRLGENAERRTPHVMLF